MTMDAAVDTTDLGHLLHSICVSSLPRLPHTAPTVFGKDSIIISYLMLNIHSTKTVSSLAVYLTLDDFRYDCNDDICSSDDEYGY